MSVVDSMTETRTAPRPRYTSTGVALQAMRESTDTGSCVDRPWSYEAETFLATESTIRDGWIGEATGEPARYFLGFDGSRCWRVVLLGGPALEPEQAQLALGGAA